jgi:hypothetical protein
VHGALDTEMQRLVERVCPDAWSGLFSRNGWLSGRLTCHCTSLAWTPGTPAKAEPSSASRADSRTGAGTGAGLAPRHCGSLRGAEETRSLADSRLSRMPCLAAMRVRMTPSRTALPLRRSAVPIRGSHRSSESLRRGGEESRTVSQTRRRSQSRREPVDRHHEHSGLDTLHCPRSNEAHDR